MQETLVTGASGFIGGQIARLLFEREKRPLRLFLRKNSSIGSGALPLAPPYPQGFVRTGKAGSSLIPAATIRHLEGIQFTPVTGDLRDKKSVQEAMRGVDVVYHVAALYALWTRRKQDFFDINVSGTENMCESALEAGVKKFVYTSTTGAIGISHSPDELCDEQTPWNRAWTNDPYTLSKYEAEQVVKKYIGQGLPAVILNPTGPIGPGDIHPTPTGKLICDFLKGKVPFYVDAHFSVVDVRDAALGHLLAEKKGKVGERYILCAENISAKELLTKLAQVAGKKPPKYKLPIPLIQCFAVIAEFLADHLIHKPPMITKPYAQLLPLYFWFDNSKSRRELGLAYRPIEEALRDAVAWFKKEQSH